MQEPADVTVHLQLEDGYRFHVAFDDPELPSLTMDEPAPLGEGAGPNAARLLAAAIAHCLSASALFCLRKAHVPVSDMTTTARAALVRNEAGRLRLGSVRVAIQPRIALGDRERVQRCLELFEDYCVVTQSVRGGVDVAVDVLPETVAAIPA
jgi:organic hydroperoxide reductase OsmC/OhrA